MKQQNAELQIRSTLWRICVINKVIMDQKCVSNTQQYKYILYSFSSHLPSECGLASCPLNFPQLVSNVCNLMAQTKNFLHGWHFQHNSGYKKRHLTI